jgi:hypothetical protein
VLIEQRAQQTDDWNLCLAGWSLRLIDIGSPYGSAHEQFVTRVVRSVWSFLFSQPRAKKLSQKLSIDSHMNSSRPISAEQPQQFTPWLERAKRCFVGATIHGSGRYCVAVMNRVDIFLYEIHEDAALHLSQDPKYRFYDLATFVPPPVHKTNLGCGNIKSQCDYEDRLWERRQQREKAGA